MPFDESKQQIEAITEHKSHKERFDINGNLLSQEPYSAEQYYHLPAKGEARWIAIPFWGWPFTHPFAGWGMIAVGSIGLRLIRRKFKAALNSVS